MNESSESGFRSDMLGVHNADCPTFTRHFLHSFLPTLRKACGRVRSNNSGPFFHLFTFAVTTTTYTPHTGSLVSRKRTRLKGVHVFAAYYGIKRRREGPGRGGEGRSHTLTTGIEKKYRPKKEKKREKKSHLRRPFAVSRLLTQPRHELSRRRQRQGAPLAHRRRIRCGF